jgi:hypothetical protein
VAPAVQLVVEDGLPYQATSGHLGRDHRVFVPYATIPNGVEARGKKAADRLGADDLDGTLDGFSGFIAADELYDGPFRVPPRFVQDYPLRGRTQQRYVKLREVSP